MRVRWKRIWVSSIAGLACVVSTGSLATAIFLDGFEDAPTFVAGLPTQSVAPGAEETRCYYFRAPATPQAVRRISSVAGSGVANLIVYATYNGSWVPQEVQPPGTVDTSCDTGFVGWLHVARSGSAETTLPADDGAGKKLAFQLAANQPLVLKVYLLNAGDQALQTQVGLTFETWDPEMETTASASYITDNINISIPQGSTDTESATCAVPANVKFWRFTARTHKQGTRMRLLDGASTILDGTDWENPPVQEYDPPAFFTFTSSLTYECTYFNPTNRTITRGDSESTDEICLGIGWYFPATKPAICLGNLGPF